jgi:RHS repeat-associated protein
VRSYTYDHANRLTQVTQGAQTTQFAYNGDGNRASKTVSGDTTQYVLDLAASLPVVVSDTEAVYLYGLDILAQQQAERQYYFHDGLGSVRQMLDSTGEVETNYAYDPFGVPVVAGDASNPYQFTGEAWDAEVELLYLRARYYQPDTGRFIAKDPWAADILRPSSLNRWVYVENNPVNSRDPTGHCGEPFLERVWNWVVEQYNRANYLVREWWAYHNPCSMSVDPMCRLLPVSPPRPSVPPQPLLLDSAQVERMREIGRWIDRAESMSGAARAYQRFISGRSDDLVFEVEGVCFDNFDESEGLLEDAKAIPDSLIDLDTHEFHPWVSGTAEWLAQAERQVGAAGGVKIVWYFSTEAARDAMYYLFFAENPELLEKIELVYEPME